MGVYRSSEHISQTHMTTGDKSGYYSNKQLLVRVYYYLNTSHGTNKDNLLTIEGFFSRRSFPILKGDDLRGNFVDDRVSPAKNYHKTKNPPGKKIPVSDRYYWKLRVDENHIITETTIIHIDRHLRDFRQNKFPTGQIEVYIFQTYIFYFFTQRSREQDLMYSCRGDWLTTGKNTRTHERESDRLPNKYCLPLCWYKCSQWFELSAVILRKSLLHILTLKIRFYIVPGFLISTPNHFPSANSAGPMYRTTPSSPLTSTLRPCKQHNENEKKVVGEKNIK